VSLLPRPYRPHGKKEASLTPLIVLINALIVGVLLLMVFFIYLFITSDELTPPSRPNVQSAADNAQNAQLIIDEPEPEPEITPTIMTRAITTPPFGAENSGSIVFIPGDFDREFFENDLFIGDSIMTGISHYRHISPANVFAKVGINPDNVRTTEIDGQTALGKATSMNPARIFIMLGSNGLDYLTAETMVARMATFAASLPSSDIIVLTIPPVTAKYAETVTAYDVMERINNINTLLISTAADNTYTVIDTTAILKDSTGYLAAEYAENDGLHFKSGAYNAMLSYIQAVLENS
jgi:lysophospholipase L1-like esterase